MHTLLPMSLNCPLLIPSSVYINVYCKRNVKDPSIFLDQLTFKLYIYIRNFTTILKQKLIIHIIRYLVLLQNSVYGKLVLVL